MRYGYAMLSALSKNLFRIVNPVVRIGENAGCNPFVIVNFTHLCVSFCDNLIFVFNSHKEYTSKFKNNISNKINTPIDKIYTI